MRRAARSLALSVVVAAALVACHGGGGDAASTTPTAPTGSNASSTPSTPPTPSTSPTVPTSPTPSDSASPAPEPVLQLPADAPSSFEGALDDGDLSVLAPPDAVIGSVLVAPGVPPDLVAFAWRRGDAQTPELGFVVWERFDDPPTWRAVFAFTDGPSKGVLGITFENGDVTGDGVKDLLTREDRGGSGACATWRVIVPARDAAGQVFRHAGCDTTIELTGDGTLSMREAVFEPGDSHCCPSAFRTTTLGWDGSAFVATDVRESPAPTP